MRLWPLLPGPPLLRRTRGHNPAPVTGRGATAAPHALRLQSVVAAADHRDHRGAAYPGRGGSGGGGGGGRRRRRRRGGRDQHHMGGPAQQSPPSPELLR